MEEEEEEKTRKVRKEGFFLCGGYDYLNLYYMEVKDVKSGLFADGRTEFKIEGNPFAKKLVSNDDSRFNVVGSCNHLICFSTIYYRDPLYILNPFENRYLSIDSPGSFFDDVGKLGYVSGFGYDVRTGNYKILKMHIPENVLYTTDDYMCASICTVHPEHGAGIWRDLRWVDHHVKHHNCGVFLRGKLYFLMYKVILEETSRRDVSIFSGVLAFDVHEETFSSVIHRPQGLRDNAYDIHMDLSMFDGNMILMHRDLERLMTHIWSMDEDASWQHMIDLPMKSNRELKFWPFTSMNDGSLLAHDGTRVVSYNIDKKQPTWTISLSDLNNFSVFPFSWVYKSTSTTLGDDDHRESNDSPNEGKFFSVWSEKFVPFEDD